MSKREAKELKSKLDRLSLSIAALYFTNLLIVTQNSRFKFD